MKLKKFLIVFGMILLAGGVVYASGNVLIGSSDSSGSDWFEGFEDGTIGDFVVDSGFEVRTDNVFEGSYSAGLTESGAGQLLAHAEPDQLEGGEQIRSFEFNYYETTSSYGGGMRLYDSDGNHVVSYATDNPQWTLYDGDGQLHDFGGGQYQDWHHVELEFNWDDGTYDYYVENLDTGVTAEGTRNLDSTKDVERIEVQNHYNEGSQWDGSANFYMWFDNVAIEGKSFASASSSQKGLVGHWTLDGESLNSATNRVTDKTPYSNHGTNNGANLTTDRMGNAEGAMSFDESQGDWVDVSSFDGVQDTQEITAMAWIRPNAASDTRAPIVRLDQFFFQHYSDNRLATYWYGWADNGYHYSTSNSVPTGEWTHVAVTWDQEDGVTFYVNGEMNNQVSNSGTGNPLHWARIGRESSSRQYNGVIEDVRVYERSLSAGEIKSISGSYEPKASSGSLKKGLVMDMPLTSKYTKDDTAGSEVMTDRTPYANDGQNNGATVGSDSTDFDGSSDFIDIDESDWDSSFPLGSSNTDMSLSVWVNPDSFSSSTTNHDTANDIFGNAAGGFDDNFELGVRNNQIDVYTEVDGTDTTIHPSTELNTGEWYLITLTKSGSDGLKVYKNGEEVHHDASQTGSFQVTSGNGFHPTIGKSGNTETFFDGSIRDVKIHDRELSSEEVGLLYDKGR